MHDMRFTSLLVSSWSFDIKGLIIADEVVVGVSSTFFTLIYFLKVVLTFMSLLIPSLSGSLFALLEQFLKESVGDTG